MIEMSQSYEKQKIRDKSSSWSLSQRMIGLRGAYQTEMNNPKFVIEPYRKLVRGEETRDKMMMTPTKVQLMSQMTKGLKFEYAVKSEHMIALKLNYYRK